MNKVLLSLFLAALAVSCTKGNDRVDRVQPNLVDKTIFEGEWWMSDTVIEADADATGVTFSGDQGQDLALDKGFAIGRIRWVIDEDFLFAYRSYELVDGGNLDGDDPEFRGQPLAAFEILDHVDIRLDYNAITGESNNVIVENTEDRRWFQRDFMRVDWSKNHIKSFSYAAELSTLGRWMVEDADFFIQDQASHEQFPASWEPQFVTVGDDPTYRFATDWPEGSEATTHYMSFVTFLSMTPGDSCVFIGGGPCQAIQVPRRLAFLRIPPNHEYAVASQSHDEFDKFGVFRTEQRTYVRGGGNPADNAQRCDSNEDCGIGGFCNPETRACAGGLNDDFGETDLLAFLRPRHNLFERSLTATECQADWQCDGRFDDTPGNAGSVCDRTARRCTIPIEQRELRRIPDVTLPEDVRDTQSTGAVVYHLNPGYPKHLVHAAFETTGNWNEVFMRGWRASRSAPVPDYTVYDVPCQQDDPTRYCFCGSVDEVGGTCKGKYDPFVSPEEWANRGVEGPYQCHIANDEFAEPARASSYDEYTLPGAYRYRFVGDECMFTLRTNTCDWYRTDAAQSCDCAPGASEDHLGRACVTDAAEEIVQGEQLGDIRYQFFNYINQSNTPFGGISTLRVDPTTGELITAGANFSAGSTESRANMAIEFFPVLRCAGERGCDADDQAAAERYLTGENLREYFSNLGRTEHPVGVATSGSDGFTINDDSRPALPVNVNQALQNAMERASARTERLYGREGRAQILSDRLRNVAGTPLESRLMNSLGTNGLEAMTRHFDHGQNFVFNLSPQARISDEYVLDQVSPFRGNGFLRSLHSGSDAAAELGERNICFVNDGIFRSRYWEYFAEAFRGRPAGEASIRIQQLYTRMVQHHELGHSVGLRHNFAGSFDRNNYGDGYFNAVMGDSQSDADDMALPIMDDFDLDSDGFVAGDEFDAYLAELRRVRNERAALGVHNYMTSSTMDYNGDTSDAQGLGRYDVAATIWNYFDLQEAYDVRGQSTDVRTDIDSKFQGLARSHEVPRTYWRSYLGGESCSVRMDNSGNRVDTDCPFAQGSSSLVAGQPVYQRCVQNPRTTTLQFECELGQSDCQCSNFDADVQDYIDDVAYLETGDVGNRNYAPVNYLFCTDDRTNDISWCNRFDAGESFREAIDHYRRTWEENYPSNYYRRFRDVSEFVLTGGSAGSIRDAAKIYQHLFFRANFEPGFSANRGPLGFDDQFLASVDAMNWLIEIVNLPDEGSYQFNTTTNTYQYMDERIDMPGADFSLLPGQGYGMWTKYQEGYFGFFRPERGGVFYDKLNAMWALAIRDWGLSFTVDERYFINFYDLFPTEMTEFFGGQLLQDTSWFAPRIVMEDGEPTVQHLSWYRGVALGECRDTNGTRIPCRGSQPEVYPGPALEGTTNEVLQSWAAILALAQFPVYYDTTFEQRLLIFKAGSGSGFTIQDIQPSGRPTCVYGSDGLGRGHDVANDAVPNGCDTADDADYVVYESERFRTPYVAVKVRPDLEFNLEEEQIGFQILRRLVDLQSEVRTLPDGDERDQKLRQLQQGESFLEYLIEVQGAYGISNFF